MNPFNSDDNALLDGDILPEGDGQPRIKRPPIEPTEDPLFEEEPEETVEETPEEQI